MRPYLRLNPLGKSIHQSLDDTFGMVTMLQDIKINKRLLNRPSAHKFFAANLPNSDTSFWEYSEICLDEVLLGLDSSFSCF